uniref:Glutamate-gated chloride channel n=1 Tax=Stomoxys calcitrans TaxID=35570 RepID=A0A1I8NT29_STOCA
MGCSFETAKHNCRINDTFDTVCHTPIITPTSRTRSIYAKTATIHYQLDSNNNNSICNQYNPKLDKTNDDCQQQKSAKAKKNTTISATTISCSNIFNCSSNSSSSNSNDSNGYTIRDELKRTLSFYSLEAKEHIYRNSHNSLKLEGKGVKLTESEEEILQESCANCYPLACHNRICCRQQNLIEGEIINHTSHCLESQPKYFNTNSCSNSICNCACVSNNSKCSCHCLASSYFCQKHKNTLRNEISRGTQGVVDCTKGAVYTKADPMPKTYFPRGQCLQRVLSHAKIALTSNTLDMKNGLAEAMGNCVKIVESLLSRSNTNTTQCRKHCMGNKTSNQITNTHNHKDNNNKSEPYRGYCQRKHHTLKPDFIPYTSTNSSCSLHDAISSKQIKQQQQHQQQYSNIKSNTNNNKVTLGKSCNNCHNATTTSTPTQTAAFNYIGHNYYHFLRNSINFYTAYTASVILVLCYLTTTTSAATPKSDATSLDKHPIKGIDWSKFDESSSDKEILDLLLEQKRYDKRLLPPVHDEDFCCGLSSPDMATEQNSRRPHKRGTLNVNVTVLLLSLASPDESSLKYEVEFLLNQFWVDPRLQYGNKSHYDFLNALHHHDSIWTPDTYFSMHGDFKDPIIPMHFALRIFRNGTIMYSMRRHLILSCQGSLHIFPFDDPKCTFSMESISYEEPQIRYVWTNGEVTLLKSPSLTTLNAYLIKNQTTACEQHSWRGNYSCLQVDLTFTRDRAYYFTTVFIPGIILVTSSFITFWLEWNAVPARVMIGVTTMLNFFTTSNGFRSTLPVVSNLTAMNVWDGVCMCFIYASLLEFVCVNYMGRKRPQHNVVYRPGENPVTQRLPAVLSRIGVILASPL